MNYGPELIRKGWYGYRLYFNIQDDGTIFCPVVWLHPDYRLLFENKLAVDDGGFALELSMNDNDEALYPGLNEYYKEHRQEYIDQVKKLMVKDML